MQSKNGSIINFQKLGAKKELTGWPWLEQERKTRGAGSVKSPAVTEAGGRSITHIKNLPLMFINTRMF